MGGMTLGPGNTFALYLNRSVRMGDDAFGKSVALSYAIPLLLAYLLGSLAVRYHPLRVGLKCMALYAVATAFGFSFASTSDTFFIAFVLHTVVSGAHITATVSIAQRLLPQNKFAGVGAGGGIIDAIIGIFFGAALGLFIASMHHDYRYVILLPSVLAVLTCFRYLRMLQHIACGGDATFRPP
ncbi:MAG: hypothetical protein JWM57_1134 [Phycisphaerales bacterium]|nr:hypothetical protein [Phycisphaerales bacterium]